MFNWFSIGVCFQHGFLYALLLYGLHHEKYRKKKGIHEAFIMVESGTGFELLNDMSICVVFLELGLIS